MTPVGYGYKGRYPGAVLAELRSCVKVEWLFWAPVPNKPTVSVDVKRQHSSAFRHSELRSCVKVEVAVLGSPSLISLMVSVDVTGATLQRNKSGFWRSSGAV